MPPHSDGIDSLPGRMAAGEEDAFRKFADQFGPRFCVYFRRWGLTDVDAEELAVSCITDVVVAIPGFQDRGSGSFPGWAFRLAHNKLVDWFDDQQRALPLIEDLDYEKREVWEEEPDDEFDCAVHVAVSRLPEPDRTIVTLRLLSVPYTFKEIGEIVGLSVGAVRVRYHRAKASLKPILEKQAPIARRLKRRHNQGGGTTHEETM